MHKSLKFAEKGAKNKKPVSSCSADLQCVVHERGQRRRARLVEAAWKVTVTQITSHYNSDIQKSISEHTACQYPPEFIVYSSRRPICLKNKSNKYLIKCSLSVYCTMTVMLSLTVFLFSVLLSLFKSFHSLKACKKHLESVSLTHYSKT